jgi:hypothetical protein
LTVKGTTAQSKYYDGTTTGTVYPGELIGLIGNETLLLTATGKFENSSVGNNKKVLVKYYIADGSNGGLANNYELDYPEERAGVNPYNEKLPANIYGNPAPTPVNPVTPVTPVTPVNPVIPVNPVNPYTPANPVKPPYFNPQGSNLNANTKVAFEEEASVCSKQHPENCICEDTQRPAVQICYFKREQGQVVQEDGK